MNAHELRWYTAARMFFASAVHRGMKSEFAKAWALKRCAMAGMPPMFRSVVSGKLRA